MACFILKNFIHEFNTVYINFQIFMIFKFCNTEMLCLKVNVACIFVYDINFRSIIALVQCILKVLNVPKKGGQGNLKLFC